MIEKNRLLKNDTSSFRAQAIVEFAIALPILLAVLIGIFEVGRYVFIYSAVTNASRSAVRYASAVGREDDNGLTKYNYCEGIKETAFQSAYLVPVSDLTIEINYDDGSGTPLSDSECNVWDSSLVDTGVVVSTGDRVTVTITAEYRPILKLLPIKPRTITSVSSRTILGIIDLD